MAQNGAVEVMSYVVTEGDLASTLALAAGDGFPAVLATARLVALMEVTAARVLHPDLGEGQLSVGVSIDMRHTAPSPVGATVVITATYAGLEGKLHRFTIEASDPGGPIGDAVHVRAVVDRAKLEQHRVDTPVTLHPRVSISTMCLPGSALADDCDWIRSIGASAISITPAKLEAADWDEGIAIVRRSGLAVATVVNTMMFALDDPDSWGPLQQDGCRVVRAAAEMGATSVYGVTGGGGALTWEQAAERYCEAVAPVRDLARSLGVALCLEPTIPLRININLCHSLRDVTTLAEMAGVGVCLDVYGCFGEAGLDTTISRAAPNMGLVQMCDYVHGTLDTPNRAVPGDGHLPVERICGWILESGYDGLFDLELNGPRIDAEGHRAANLRGAVALSSILDRLGA